MTRQEYANIELQEFQQTCPGLTERRLKDFREALDDLRSLASRRDGAHVLRLCRADLEKAMRSLLDLYMDLEITETQPPIVHLSELRELRRAAS